MFCECSDPGCPCPAHRQPGGNCMEDYAFTVYRVDMEDHTGTPMCQICGEDALGSGVFDIRD